MFILFYEDQKSEEGISTCIQELNLSGVNTFEVRYEQSEEAVDSILKFIDGLKGTHRYIYVDYSTMPRTWYSRLPMRISTNVNMEVRFLYVVGDYPCDYKTYPSAGIDSYTSIGLPSLRDKKRLHVIGIGYDVIRTEALISILDPDMYAVCSAHYSKDDEIEQKVLEVNKHVLEHAVSSIELITDDFAFLTAKLREIANEYLPLGDVVFVPDGPKPLIMAMSLVPQIIGKEGVTCVHVSRNIECKELLNVKPTDNILCFGFENHI